MRDIERRRGDTYADMICLKDKRENPIDITGYTFTLTVSKDPRPEDKSKQLYDIEGVIVEADKGTVEFAPTGAQAHQKAGVYYYDIEMRDELGRIRTIEHGKYTYIQDITKSDAYA